MVRWRLCLLLAMLLIIPNRGSSKSDDDEEETFSKPPSYLAFSVLVLSIGVKWLVYRFYRRHFGDRMDDPEEEEEEEEDDDDDSPPTQKLERTGSAGGGIGRRAPATPRASAATELVTRTVARRPLECYVCAYKAETKLRSCLDPTKYRVHTMICHSAEDKCFTSVISKGTTYEAVMRGCRSGCVASPETTCCELNRCNNQALAVPVTQPHALAESRRGKSNKTIPPSVLFFVTILLVLQTVVKVAFA